MDLRARAHRQMGLASAGRPRQQDVAGLGDEGQIGWFRLLVGMGLTVGQPDRYRLISRITSALVMAPSPER